MYLKAHHRQISDLQASLLFTPTADASITAVMPIYTVKVRVRVRVRE